MHCKAWPLTLLPLLQVGITYATPRKVIFEDVAFPTFTAVNHTHIIPDELSHWLGPRNVSNRWRLLALAHTVEGTVARAVAAERWH